MQHAWWIRRHDTQNGWKAPKQDIGYVTGFGTEYYSVEHQAKTEKLTTRLANT